MIDHFVIYSSTSGVACGAHSAGKSMVIGYCLQYPLDRSPACVDVDKGQTVSSVDSDYAGEKKRKLFEEDDLWTRRRWLRR